MREGPGRRAWAGTSAALASLLVLWLATLAPDPWEWDELHLIAGIRDGIDLRHNRPHPPGYPLFIEAGRAIHACGPGPFTAATLVGVLGSFTGVLGTLWLALELGSTLALRAMGLQGGQIFDPAGEPALGLGGTDDVLLDDLGFYELVGGGRNEIVAVNFDVRESNLVPVDAATLERWRALGQPGAAVPTATAAASAGETVPTPLGYWILFLVLLALGVESWVGNWHLRIRRGIAA